MQPNRIQSIIFVLIFSASVCLAVEGGSGVIAPAEDSGAATAEVSGMAFPYVAEILGTDINLRSGPGMNYYRCGTVSGPDTVTVVGGKFSWLMVVPPAGSFSWISKQYVKIDVNSPSKGVVTGDEVRVWAGSDYVEPMHSTSLQTKLSSGDTIELLGEEKADYYKIAPPAGARLWISNQYVKAVGPAGGAGVASSAVVETKGVIESNQPAVVAAKTSAESESLNKYYGLVKQLDAEKVKPVADQNYVELKKAFTALVEDAASGKAGRYSKFQLEQIDRFELAIKAGDQTQDYDAQLAQKLAEIRSQREEAMASIKDMGKYAVIGKLSPSRVYGEGGLKRYLVVDDSGKLLCYAEPVGKAVNTDLSKLMNIKVGLVGTIESNPQTSMTVVKFTEAVAIK